MMVRSLSYNRGQVLPFAILGLTIGCAVLLLMYNTGQKITDKTVVANAADAAAYSAGIWTSRHLNYMAYTNRAMIANHVGTGHFVSYVGWLRYVQDSTDKLSRLTSWIPYVGAAVSAANQYAEGLVEVAETAAPYAIPGIELLNDSYFASQVEAQFNLTYFKLNTIMEETAKVYDPDIRINEVTDMSGLPVAVRTVLTARIASQRIRIPAFVESFSPGSDDDGEISSLVGRSYGPSRRWIAGNRGWSKNPVPGLIKIRKTGSTTHQMDDDITDWDSTDRLRLGIRKWDGWDWTTLGKGKATAREFDSDYRGINNYYNVSEEDPSRIEGLYITVYATKRQRETHTEVLLPLGTDDPQGDNPLNATATAMVEFKRPEEGFGSSREEYGSLYNPFWEPKLVNQSNVVGF
jgi:hypothetical protein